MTDHLQQRLRNHADRAAQAARDVAAPDLKPLRRRWWLRHHRRTIIVGSMISGAAIGGLIIATSLADASPWAALATVGFTLLLVFVVVWFER